ncbi:MAG TPA: preprotein translocase subunit YajC [Flavobacteriales bacterium]|nr:preprotein translocase subunit YajC [Flavobacteriales bacterium]
MHLLQILLMGPTQEGSNPMGTFIMLGLIMLVFYFFMIRPQMKKTKDQRKFKEEINKGDKIITIGGIHGKISEIRDQAFIIDVENGGKLKIDKSSVSMEMTRQLDKPNK